MKARSERGQCRFHMLMAARAYAEAKLEEAGLRADIERHRARKTLGVRANETDSPAGREADQTDMIAIMSGPRDAESGRLAA